MKYQLIAHVEGSQYFIAFQLDVISVLRFVIVANNDRASILKGELRRKVENEKEAAATAVDLFGELWIEELGNVIAKHWS